MQVFCNLFFKLLYFSIYNIIIPLDCILGGLNSVRFAEILIIICFLCETQLKYNEH